MLLFVFTCLSQNSYKKNPTITHGPAHKGRAFLLALVAVLAVLNSCCKAFVSAPLPCCMLQAACKPGSPHAHAALWNQSTDDLYEHLSALGLLLAAASVLKIPSPLAAGSSLCQVTCSREAEAAHFCTGTYKTMGRICECMQLPALSSTQLVHVMFGFQQRGGWRLRYNLQQAPARRMLHIFSSKFTSVT